MTHFSRLSVSVASLIFSAGTCSAQAIVEHSAAATIGAIGSAGGKKISDALDQVLKKTSSALERSASPEVRKPSAGKPPNSQPAGTAAGSPASATDHARSASPRRAHPPAAIAPVQGPAPAPVRAAAPPPAAATPEAFAQVASGASRRELAAALGSPAYRIVVPDGGQLVEIYRFTAKGADLGTVRVVDGTVTEIRPSAR